MNIRLDKIISAIILLIGAVVLLRISAPVVSAVTNLLENLSHSRHPDSISPEAVLIILIGFILITSIAVLKLLLRRDRNSGNISTGNGYTNSQPYPRRTKFWHNRNQGGQP